MKLLLLCMILILSGCGTTITQVREYQMPEDYDKEIIEAMGVLRAIPLKYMYDVRSGDCSSGGQVSDGIMSNGQRGYNICIDKLFMKYVYREWYYNWDKMVGGTKKILASLILHEVGHRETGLGDTPVETHLQVDLWALKVGAQVGISRQEYLQMLRLLDSYASMKAGPLNEVGRALVGVTTGLWFSERDVADRISAINLQ